MSDNPAEWTPFDQMTESSSGLRVTNDELFTVRDAMRGLNQIVDSIEAGDLDKAVLMRGTRMVAAIVSVADATR